MNRVQAVVLTLLVLVVAAPLAAVPSSGDVQTGPSAVTAVEADEVEFRIIVYENASARWTFTYTRLLENESERQQFRTFAEEFEGNDTDAFSQFQAQASGLAANGRNVTGRDMRATDFAHSASLGGTCVTTTDCGTVRMSFTWTDFAAPDGDRLVVGDVFGTGIFLSADQQLVFEAGPGLTFESASPDDYTPSGTDLADSDSITYEGKRSFADRRPRVVLGPADQQGGAGGTADSPAGNDPTGTDPGGDAAGFPMALVGGILVVVVGAGAAFVWWRGDGTASFPIPIGPGGDGGSPAESASDDQPEPAVPEEELLTDEDRVLRLLEGNGGRMKQVDIVEETGWSKSKVSMLLSDMDEEDHISKLRVGRENIISLAGHEPEAAGSPHEED